MSAFTPIFNPSDTRPRSQFFSGLPVVNFVRDALTLPTWIAIGALLQSALWLLLPTRYAILPAIFYLATRLIDTLLILQGIRANPQMANVVQGKTSAQFPGSTAPSQQPVVVIKLAARSNHALGTFHPHIRAIGDYFKRMIKELDDHSDEYDYLGANSYLGVERDTSNEIMVMVYFRTYEGLHKFAHAPGGVHREAWDYWNTEIMGKGNAEEGRMFSIMHEAYQIPAQKWENIYINYNPSGMGATTFKVDGDVGGKEKWVSPLVDARKGLLRTSKGRMAATEGDDNDIYQFDPYAA